MKKAVAAKKKVPVTTTRRKRGEERRAKLVDRACVLFLEHGYDGVSLDDLVRECGGSKSCVYDFFGGKEGLFLAAMEALVADIAAPVKGVDLKGLSLRSGLRKFAKVLLGILLEERHLAIQRLIFSEGRRHPDMAQNWYQTGPAVAHAGLEAFLRDQHTRGHLRPGIDLGQTAILIHDVLIFDLMARALAGLSIGNRDKAIAAKVDQAVALITGGVAAKAS